MAPDFFNLSYLSSGSVVQRKALEVIEQLGVMEILSDYHPVLAGTLPLDLFLPESDLDILCFSPELRAVEVQCRNTLSTFKNFSARSLAVNGTDSFICSFEASDFKFEIFSQPVPVYQQTAYRHMVAEFNILERNGPAFREKILNLKRNGLKTEPAFAQLLGLAGDPYEALLTYRL